MSRKIYGYQVASTRQLTDILERRYKGRNVIFSDLYYGSFKSHHVASEFAWQLNIDISGLLPFSSDAPVSPRPDRLLNFSTFVSKGIDEESVGEKGIFIASNLAKYILEQSHGTSLLFAVLLPSPAILFSKENQHFILKLIKELPHTQHNLVLFYNSRIGFIEKIRTAEFETGTESDTSPVSLLSSPEFSCYSLIQGLIRQDYIEKIGNKDPLLVPINDKAYLFPFELRPGYPKKHKTLYDKLSKLLKDEQPILADANLNGSAYFLNRDFLTGYAWVLVAHGCVDIAVAILSRLVSSSASNIEKAILITQIQGLRISAWAFEDVAKEQIIAGNVPPDLLQFQLLSKGWGAVKVNNLDVAGKCFQEINNLLDRATISDEEYCYFQNIYALYDFKKGNADEALKKEKKIEAYFESAVNKDFRLHFVNAINQARIFRYFKDYATSLLYYQRAFSTINGVHRQGDLVYKNFLYAKIFRDLHDSENSLLHFVRASLYTLCMDDDELINKRLKANVRYSEKDSRAFIDFFKDILSEKVTELCNEIIPGFSGLQSNIPSFTFKSTSKMPEEGSPVLVTDLKYTFSYKLAPLSDGEQRHTSAEHKNLNEVVSALLFSFFPGIFDCRQSYTIYIPDNNGYDMPENEEELINYVAFQNYAPIHIKLRENHSQSASISISSDPFKNISGKAIRLSSSVSKVEKQKDGQNFLVSYKRYLPDKFITDTNEIFILDTLLKNDKMQDYPDPISMHDFVNYRRELEHMFNNKIIEFSKL